VLVIDDKIWEPDIESDIEFETDDRGSRKKNMLNFKPMAGGHICFTVTELSPVPGSAWLEV
jgi:hypothetical protein